MLFPCHDPIEALNDQLNFENYSAYISLSMAAYAGDEAHVGGKVDKELEFPTFTPPKE